MLRVEPFEIHSVANGTIRLDGGAMFGVVPKVLWADVADVDEANRILLATRTLVAVDRGAGRVILVDTGCGSKWAPEQARRFAIEHDAGAIGRCLESLGLSCEAVTDIVVTHLHFDHNGGLTEWTEEPGGATKPRYPRARHWIHREHLEHAQRPHLKDKASFIRADFECLVSAGLLTLVEGEDPEPPFEGAQWIVSQGHTPYQLHPVFGSGAEKLAFAGDLVPTMAHLRPGWVMAYDVRPMETIDEKRALYRRCLEDGWHLAFPHDPKCGGVRIDGTVERPIVAQALDL